MILLCLWLVNIFLSFQIPRSGDQDTGMIIVFTSFTIVILHRQ